MDNRDLIKYIHFNRNDYQVIYCVYCKTPYLKHHVSCLNDCQPPRSKSNNDDILDYSGLTTFGTGA